MHKKLVRTVLSNIELSFYWNSYFHCKVFCNYMLQQSWQARNSVTSSKICFSLNWIEIFYDVSLYIRLLSPKISHENMEKEKVIKKIQEMSSFFTHPLVGIINLLLDGVRFALHRHTLCKIICRVENYRIDRAIKTYFKLFILFVEFFYSNTQYIHYTPIALWYHQMDLKST